MELDEFIALVKEQQGIDLSGVLTTADKIARPQSSLDRDAFDDFNVRNPMAGGGMLVQPSADGSRPGYSKDKKKINRDESYRKVVKDFVATSGPGTGQIFDDPAAIEIVKANLNKIKKQRNNKALFEWSEDSDWYRKLRKELNPNTKTGTNREYTNKLINQVVDEFFPGAYHGKNAIKNFRNDMVVKSFIQHLKSVGEFDGQEKFDKVLDQFTYKKDGKRKSTDHLYEDINRSWKSWINGEFEVDGVDRAQLKKELKARGIDYSQIDNWKAAQTQKRGTEKIAEIKFLDNQNSKFPNRSVEQVEELFKKKFPNGNFYLRVNNLTEIKRNGVYVSGATSERSITGIDKGDRAGWLKKAYGKQFAGNYSKIINAADQLAAAGETAKAERLYRAADKFFGPTGLIRKSAIGEAEHALARSFDFLNPDRQLAINSIVSGDLNQFKKNLFDIPVKRYFDEYNNPNTTNARRVELKNLIEERKKVMNALTGGQKSGIVAGDIVNFRYGANEITATSSVKPIDTLFKEGKFNIDDYIERGNKYTEAFQSTGREAGILTPEGNILENFKTPINENKVKKLVALLGGDDCGRIRKYQGGRMGLQDGTPNVDVCFKKGIDRIRKGGVDFTRAEAINFNKLTKGLRAIGASNIMKFGILPEVLLEGALIADKMASEGDSFMQGLRNSYVSIPFQAMGMMKTYEEGRKDEILAAAPESQRGKVLDVMSMQDTLKKRNELAAQSQNLKNQIEDTDRISDGAFGYVGDSQDLQKRLSETRADLQDLYRGDASRAERMLTSSPLDLNIKDELTMDAYKSAVEKANADRASNILFAPGAGLGIDTQIKKRMKELPITPEYAKEQLKATGDYYGKGYTPYGLNKLFTLFGRQNPKFGFDETGKYSEEKGLNDYMNYLRTLNFAENFRDEKAGGGIAKLAGIDQGPPPESGPNSQGLQGLLNRVKKI